MAELPPELQRAERWTDRLMIAVLCLLSFAGGGLVGAMLMLAKLTGR